MSIRESTLVLGVHAADSAWRTGGVIAPTEAYMRVFPRVTDGLA